MAMNRSMYAKQMKPGLVAKPKMATKPGVKRLAKAKTPIKVKRGYSK